MTMNGVIEMVKMKDFKFTGSNTLQLPAKSLMWQKRPPIFQKKDRSGKKLAREIVYSEYETLKEKVNDCLNKFGYHCMSRNVFALYEMTMMLTIFDSCSIAEHS